MPSDDHQGSSKARNILLAGAVPTVASAAVSRASCRDGPRSMTVASGSAGMVMITCRAVTVLTAPPGACTVSDTPPPDDGATRTTVLRRWMDAPACRAIAARVSGTRWYPPVVVKYAAPGAKSPARNWNCSAAFQFWTREG